MADRLLPEQIAARLRRDILCGKLVPGASIKERDNAADLGVSRTPMREAIRLLSREGLVVLRPSRSPIVANPTWKEVGDHLDVLQSLELLSCKLACRHASDEEIEAIAAIQGRMEQLADTIDEVDLFELDMEFHVAIVVASKNMALAETYRAYLARLWRARFLGSRKGRNQDQVFTEHRGMIEGLRARDARRTRAMLTRHLGALRRQIRGHFEIDDRVGNVVLPQSDIQADAPAECAAEPKDN